MGVLHQDALGQQPLADLPPRAQRGVHVDPRPQAAGAEGPDPPAHQRRQAVAQHDAQLGRPPLVLARLQQPHHRGAHRRRQRVPAERRAVRARAQHAQHLAPAHHRGHRHDAAAQRLAQQHQVGGDLLQVHGQRGAGPPQPRLDLVGDEQAARPPGDLPDPRQVAVVRHDHPRLALHRLQQHRRRRPVHGRLERGQVVVRDDTEARRERAEAGPGRLVGGEAHDRGRPAVEVVGGDHDRRPALGDALDLVGPLARHLHRALHRLGAGVHGQHHLLPGQRRQPLREARQLVVVERPRGQRETVQLPVGRLHQHRMAVAEVQGGVTGQQVEVAAALHVLHPGALRPGHHHRQRMVVGREDGLLGADQPGGVPPAAGHGTGTGAGDGAGAVGAGGVDPAAVGVAGAAGAAGGNGGRGHDRTSRVQHLMPPPALRNSDRSTGTGT